MNDTKSNALLAVAWVGTLLTWLFHNWNTVLSTGAVVAAIVASVYSALSHRAKKKFYEKEAALLDQSNHPKPFKDPLE